MKLREAGLSLEDIDEIITVLYAEGQTLEDVNGAPPPQTVDVPTAGTPNPDYIRYLRLNKIVQTYAIFHDMVTEFDEMNMNGETNPAVVITVQVGGWE